MTTPSATQLDRRGGMPPVRVAALEDISRRDWDRLYEATPAATPFSSWTFHRAWWDAYGDGAEPHYLLVGQRPVRGLVPLMIRPAPDATGRVVYLAATYHADYATVLAAGDDLATVAEASIDHLAGQMTGASRVRAIDLRRLRADDPFLARLETAARGRATALGWAVEREQEDVCPTVELAADWSEQLARLGKKTRHELRRKLRRAQAQGPLRFRFVRLDADAASRFIDLHQARWGADGLFADTDEGRRSRRFLHRLVELEAGEGPRARFHLGEVVIGERTIYMLAGFGGRSTCYFYNAGMDSGSLDLSPGVVGAALYLQRRIEAGDTHFDFLRGDEPYKYEWGAHDEPIHRLLIRPRDGR